MLMQSQKIYIPKACNVTNSCSVQHLLTGTSTEPYYLRNSRKPASLWNRNVSAKINDQVVSTVFLTSTTQTQLL